MTNSVPSASSSLKVLVVGGSISGLAAAHALQQAGHRVTVFEASSGNTISHGGLRSPPNMTRILNRWGLSPSLEKLGVKCSGLTMLEGVTGEGIASMIFHEKLIEQLGADFLTLQHGDLWKMLYDLAVQSGVEIQFNTRVLGVNSDSLSLTLENGDRVSADVIVGADGPRSIVREYALGGFDEGCPSSGDLTLTFTLPSSAVEEDEDLRWLAHTSEWPVWLGDGYIAHGCRIHGGNEISVMLCSPNRTSWNNRFNEDWSDRIPLSELELEQHKFDPRLWKLLHKAEVFTASLHRDKPQLESIVCEYGRVVLVGEAAHPFMTEGQYKAALSVEDAEFLGCLFSRITDISQVPAFLSGYEESRQGRYEKISEWERRKRHLLLLPPGPEQQTRDQEWRSASQTTDWADVDASMTNEVWSSELETFVYDAAEAVEDWWAKWGPILRGSGEDAGKPPLEVSVTSRNARS